MPPKKDYDETKVGATLQGIYALSEILFDPKSQKTFRDQFFDLAATEDTARELLGPYGIVVAPGVKIMVVDIENARTRTFGTIDAVKDDFYVFVMPPVPRRSTTKDYKDSQAWEGAWYHSIVDGYGM
jgi:hypothetical protein